MGKMKNIENHSYNYLEHFPDQAHPHSALLKRSLTTTFLCDVNARRER